MKILIDMNLSPDWTAAFAAVDIESVHWSMVGDPRAEDVEIVETHGHTVISCSHMTSISERSWHSRTPQVRALSKSALKILCPQVLLAPSFPSFKTIARLLIKEL